MHTVRVAAPGASPTKATVKTGDVVRVTMNDGRTAQFTVWRVEASSITARGGGSYPTNEIAKLQRESFSVTDTSAPIIGVPLLIAGIFALYAEPACC